MLPVVPVFCYLANEFITISVPQRILDEAYLNPTIHPHVNFYSSCMFYK